MPTVDEVALASEAEVEVYLRQLLRPGEDFSISFEDLWIARIILGRGDDAKLLWDHVGFDRRFLLLDAYGWLWKRTQPAVSPIWQRRKELTREDVARRAASSRVPDPEDIDPDEVRAVYEGQHPHHHGKKV